MRFTWSPAKDWLRYGMLAVFIAALAAGAGSVVALLAPYSTYGRIVSNLFSPVYRWGNNLLACFAERIDSYAFYTTEVWVRSVPAFIIAAAAFILIAVLAWRNGRTWCNTVCPVGTVLGFLSRFSLFKIRIDAGKCKSCSLKCHMKGDTAALNAPDAPMCALQGLFCQSLLNRSHPPG